VAKDLDFPTASLRKDIQVRDDQIKRIYQLADDETRRLREMEQAVKSKPEKEQFKTESKRRMAELKERILNELDPDQREKLLTFSSPKDLRTADQLIERLNVDESKKEDVRQALTAVLDHQRAWDNSSKTLRDELNRLIESRSDVESKMEEIRSKRQEFESKLKTLQDALRDLCTPTQQAILVVEKILP
jgi:chromosome segregation ATPase